MSEPRASSPKRVSPILLQQTVVPDYRAGMVEVLSDIYGERLTVCCGERYFDATTVTSANGIATSLTPVRNRFLVKRRLLWQAGVMSRGLRADVAVLEFNPRILSNWAVLAARRALRRPTVLWGHAWSRSGRDSRTNRLRGAMRRLSSVTVVYTERQRQELLASSPRARVLAAPNALYRQTDFAAAAGESLPRDVLFVGRLIPSKKPTLLVRAFLMATENGLPQDVRLVIAGDGPERDAVVELANRHPGGHRVAWLGHVPPDRVRALYEEAFVSASPGYVGLSMIQTLAFGVPMIYARDEPHSPEIEAVEQGFNAVEVPSDDAAALADELVSVAAERAMWASRRQLIAEQCRERYSVEEMARQLEQAVAAAAAS